ncbi:hypothetical protein [Tenacibaculum sp.]|uniref:hypothetical protein n=1 Tax=Tenacibaculum sp. TaxID=1906242 RepID=UPI003D0C4F19
MELTGKCKEDFYNWAKDKGIIENWKPKQYSLNVAYAMIYGVYVDFFDSVGLNILTYTPDSFLYYTNILSEGRYLINVGGYRTRQESIEKAIIKANEIYNEK